MINKVAAEQHTKPALRFASENWTATEEPHRWRAQGTLIRIRTKTKAQNKNFDESYCYRMENKLFLKPFVLPCHLTQGLPVK